MPESTRSRSRPDRVAVSDLGTAVYCPRQLYYARREDERGAPDAVERRQSLAFRYPELRTAADATLRDLPVEPPPSTYRAALNRLADRTEWDALVAPQATRVTLRGKDCVGVAHKVLGGDATGEGPDGDADTDAPDDANPPIPTFVSGGVPPESGVWETHAVRAVALAKALSWERERAVPRALVEYPAVGAVREVRLTTGKRARYRRALRTVRELDGPPPRIHDDEKCGACDYRDQCGVRTRSLRSLLGL